FQILGIVERAPKASVAARASMPDADAAKVPATELDAKEPAPIAAAKASSEPVVPSASAASAAREEPQDTVGAAVAPATELVRTAVGAERTGSMQGHLSSGDAQRHDARPATALGGFSVKAPPEPTEGGFTATRDEAARSDLMSRDASTHRAMPPAGTLTDMGPARLAPPH